jgi:hypothetical protein
VTFSVQYKRVISNTFHPVFYLNLILTVRTHTYATPLPTPPSQGDSLFLQIWNTLNGLTHRFLFLDLYNYGNMRNMKFTV